MTSDFQQATIETRTEMASAVQQLGHALVSHQIDEPLAAEIAATAQSLTVRVNEAPRRHRSEEMRPPTPEEMAQLIEAAALREERVDEGQSLDLFNESFVSGRANPMAIGARMSREGDTAVAEVVLGPMFEGAPGRGHGGAVAAIVDELMGAVLTIVREVAYTANLNIDYVAGAPVGKPLKFTARLRDRADRKLWIEARGETDSGVFVRAEGLFLTVDAATFSKPLT